MVALKKLHAATLISTLSLWSIVNALGGAYIVEFEDSFSADQFHDHLAANDIKASPRLELAHSLFNGASFRLHDPHDNEATLGDIKSLDMVKQLWPITIRRLPKYDVSSVSGLSAASFQKRSIPEDSTADTYVTHVMGGVDKLRNHGYSGEGLSIAIIDSGIDYTNPWLGGGFGPGHKIAYGYDLVGDNFNGSLHSPAEPDDDPMDQRGHGTHVAGILGADPGNPYGISGVVPNATLGIFKVFGYDDETPDDILIAATHMAVDAGADIITSSVGGPLDWAESAWDVVIARVVASGTPCSISVGNDGPDGTFNANFPAAVGATSVGSIDSLYHPALLTNGTYTIQNTTDSISFDYAQGTRDSDFGTASFPLYALTLNASIPDDACSPPPLTTPNLSDYVVLIRRGTCYLSPKVDAVLSFGAKRVMFYNNIPGEAIQPTEMPDNIPVGMVSADVGNTWIKSLAAGTAVTLHFAAQADSPVFLKNPKNNLTGGYMSAFSSWSPTYELDTKPDLSAPSGYILSTYLVANGSFAVFSGTSMAAPYIAGCIALIKQIRGKQISPLEIKNLMVTTAKPVDWNNGSVTSNGVLAPVIQQGGGLIDVFAAAYAKTVFSVSKLMFNDTAHFVERNPFVIKNTGAQSVTYTFGNVGAPTVLALDADSIIPSPFPPTFEEAKCATIVFTTETVTIEPGNVAEISTQLTPPSGLVSKRVPIYSGFVTVNGSNGEYFTLPYAGVVGNMYDVKLTDTQEGYPFFANSSLTNGTYDASIAINASETTPKIFTLPRVNNTYLPNSTSYPTLSWNLAMGSRIVRIDCVPESNLSSANVTNVLGVDCLGAIRDYHGESFRGNARNNITAVEWSGQLSDYSFVPEGMYKLLFRALKIFGDQDRREDYEEFWSPVFGVEYEV